MLQGHTAFPVEKELSHWGVSDSLPFSLRRAGGAPHARRRSSGRRATRPGKTSRWRGFAREFRGHLVSPAGAYAYYITEERPKQGAPGVTYSDALCLVTVTVVENAAEGKLGAPGTASMSGKLSDLLFTQDDAGKTLSYEIREDLPECVDAASPSREGVVYDLSRFVMEVEPKDKGDGTMSVSARVFLGEMTFHESVEEPESDPQPDSNPDPGPEGPGTGDVDQGEKPGPDAPVDGETGELGGQGSDFPRDPSGANGGGRLPQSGDELSRVAALFGCASLSMFGAAAIGERLRGR